MNWSLDWLTWLLLLVFKLAFCCPLAAAARSGGCGGAAEGAGPGPDPDEQYDSREGGRV